MVFLHPLGTSVWTWEYIMDSVAQNYTCYAFDMLGHGDSDKPNRHFNLPDYANALDHACQILNIHRAPCGGQLGGSGLGPPKWRPAFRSGWTSWRWWDALSGARSAPRNG